MPATTERINIVARRIKTPGEMKSPPGIGILNDILETLRFRSTIFFRSQLAAPWGFSLDSESAPRFHICLDGEFFVGEAEHSRTVAVQEMEIVLLPGGQGHWIADRPGRRLVSSDRAQEACRLGTPLFQKGAATHLVMCGISRFDTDLSHPLVEALPSLVHFPRFEHDTPIWRLVQLISTEAESTPTLHSPILDRLTEALFLRLLQEFIDQGEAPMGFVAALRDRSLRNALDLLHNQPGSPWTIEELAHRVALSRATLVRRFRDSVGVPPIEYLKRWRLLKAHQLVRSSAAPIEKIAGQVGFSSAQTLTRAFKRAFGVTPSGVRREAAVHTRNPRPVAQ